jgi:hypothetical protein
VLKSHDRQERLVPIVNREVIIGKVSDEVKSKFD